MPQASSGPSVAKIFPRTRKSGWSMCAFSDASGRPSASLRNSSAVMVVPLITCLPLNDHTHSPSTGSTGKTSDFGQKVQLVRAYRLPGQIGEQLENTHRVAY